MGDYHSHFLKFASEYLGYLGWRDDYDGSQSFKTWFCSAFNTDIHTFRDIKLAYRQGAQKRSMPVRTWSRSAIQMLREAGAEIWITTTRPYMRLDNVDPDTRFWLQRHGLKFDYLLYDEHKYVALADRMESDRVCAVLDDQNDDLLEASRCFGYDACVLYATDWNVAHHRQWHSASAQNVCSLLLDKVEEWSTNHGHLFSGPTRPDKTSDRQSSSG
jgi:hypothetical protein